jgi:hypothetical protein
MEHEDEEGTWSMRALMSTYTCHVITTLRRHDAILAMLSYQHERGRL